MPSPLCRPIDRIRRNHALEHATIQVLTAAHPGTAAAGWSDARGFWVYGNISTEQLGEALQTALGRLRSGDARLAIHPHCGTNYAVPGLLAGLAGWLGMLGSGRRMRDQLERLPLVILFTTLAFMFSMPLGPLVQERFTTNANLGRLFVLEVNRVSERGIPLHRVITAG